MRRLALLGAVVVATAPLPALADIDALAAIDGDALRVRQVPRRSPAPPSPAVTPAPVLRAPAAAAPSPEWLKAVQAVPAGAIVLQQGGFNQGLAQAAGHGIGTSAVGLAMRGTQADMRWRYTSQVDRQDAQWLLGEFNVTGEFKDKTHFAVGDEQAPGSPLLMEAVPLRGLHAALSPHGVDTRVFVGQDRPVINSAAAPRTTAGLGAAGQLGGLPLRALGVFHDATEAQRWSSAASLGSTLHWQGARLDAELAASTAAGPGDTAWMLDAEVPLGTGTLAASYVRLGPHFQVVRHLQLPQEGGRESWSARWAMPFASAWRAHAQLTDVRSNLGGQPNLPHQSQRLGVAGLAWEPEGGPSAAISYGRTELESLTPEHAFETTYHRVASEVRFLVPHATQSRLSWQWWNNQLTGGTAASAHQLALQSGRLFQTPLSLSEGLTIDAGGPTRLVHGLGLELSWPQARLQADTRLFYDHPLTAPGDPSGQLGLALGLAASISPLDSINLTAQADRRVDGLLSSVRWGLHYTTRFGGGGSPEAPVTPMARIAGRVYLAPHTAALPTDSLTVVLDRVQRAPLDAEGRFAFEHLAPGKHTLELDTARLPMAFAIPRARRSLTVTLAPEQAVTDLAFLVGPSHALEGHVRLADGRPVAFMGVVLEGPEPLETWTDDAGRFVFDGLAEGRVRVRLGASPPGTPYVWPGAPVEVQLAAGRNPPPLAFTVEPQGRPILKVALPSRLDAFAPSRPAPSAAIARAAGGYALTVRHVPATDEAWLRFGQGTWQRLRKQPDGTWRLSLKRLPPVRMGQLEAELRTTIGSRAHLTPLTLAAPPPPRR